MKWGFCDRMGIKHRQAIQILNLDVRQKDIYKQRPLLGADELIYDSTGHGWPIRISSQVLRETKLPVELPFYYSHHPKRIVLGKVTNLKYDSGLKAIVGDVDISRRWSAFVLDKFKEGINGLSVEFDSLERRSKYVNTVLSLKLECVCLVDRPASHIAMI